MERSCCDVRCDFGIKTMLCSSLPPLLVGGFMSHLLYLCLLPRSGVQYIMCCGF